MRKESAELLLEGAKRLGVILTREQVEKLGLFLSELLAWNKKINLTAITDEREIVVKHFLDSLSCLLVESARNCSSLIDIGSGAGFPGIPLAISRDIPNLALLESSKKKAEFLAKSLGLLGLQGKVLLGRAEKLAHTEERETYELAVARAVSSLSVLCEYALPFIKEEGAFIAQKSKGLAKELESARKAVTILGGAEPEIIRVELPFISVQRYLVVIKKRGETPQKYPRRAGVPQKKPLGESK